MLLILGFAESSSDSESIFRSRDGETPERKRAVLLPSGGGESRGRRLMAVADGERIEGAMHQSCSLKRM